MREPIRILAATESHVVFEWRLSETSTPLKSILSYEWLDDNWTSYDDLMGLTSDEHIDLMQKLQAEGESK